jgi:cytochrome c peroxidase
MMKSRTFLSAAIVLGLTSMVQSEEAPSMVGLGKKLYFDSNLSEPVGQSCASCHLPGAGFADPDRELPVSRGVHPDRFGDRNTPSAAYALYSPRFHFDPQENVYIGGQFWDGRASTLEEQAKGPFLNPLEMANADPAAVIRKIRKASYAGEFAAIFGENSLRDVTAAYEFTVRAIAAFERSEPFHPFTSQYDFFLAGKLQLTEQQALGLKLFDAENKGNCAACHPSRTGDSGQSPLFTDFTYDNLGVPVNPDNPFYTQPSVFNPKGADVVDIGLAKTTGRSIDRGKFKVPTLRNIALTAPYMHNGLMMTLREVVDFYNTRDTRNDWGSPEVAENINTEELGNLGLTNEEVDAIVAFMQTLTDGYQPSSGQSPAENKPAAASGFEH